MPKLLDLEISSGWLAVRVILGLLAAGLVFLIFYYLPLNLGPILNSLVSQNMAGAGGQIVSNATNNMLDSLLSPLLPYFGLVLTVVTFSEILMRGTKVYGPILITSGALWLAVVFIIFEGGNIFLPLDQSLLAGLSNIVNNFAIGININVTLMMFLFMLPSIVTIAKGAILTYDARVQLSATAQS